MFHRVVVLLSLAAALPACALINNMSGMSQLEDLQKVGRREEAVILRIFDTGMTVNDDPVVGFALEVQPEDADPYEAQTKMLISRLSVSQVQPGTRVAVLVDPAQPTRVSIVPGTAHREMPHIPAFAQGPAFEPTPPPVSELEPEKQRLLATGVAGTATIMQSRALGMYDADGRPVYDLVLDISVPGHPNVTGPVRVGVPKDRESFFTAGQKLPIRADADAPTRFAVDWDHITP